MFIEERPVGTGDDVLFAVNRQLGSQLDQVADHLVAVASGAGDRQSGTFLVSGGWGTGKSSALTYLKDHVTAKAGAGEVLFVDYPAPQYEHAPRSARATLMYQLLRAVDDRRSAAGEDAIDWIASDLVLRIFGRDPVRLDGDLHGVDQGEARHIQNQAVLMEALESSTASGVVIEHWLDRYRRHRQDGAEPVTVICIDDLDRCGAAFAKDVLTATNHWSCLQRHFFVIAADESRLLDVLHEHADPGPAPEHGLRKYVHVTISLPDKLDKEGGQRMFGRFVDDADLPEQVAEALRAGLAAVREKERGERMALLEPLVDGEVTPRTMKERFNGLVSRLAGQDSVKELDLRQYVMALCWPAEYSERVMPARLGEDDADWAWMGHFVQLGASALRGGSRRLQRLAVQQLAERSGLAIGTADPLLAVYLASDDDSVYLKPPPGRDGRIRWDDEVLLAGRTEASDSPKVGAASGTDYRDLIRDLSLTEDDGTGDGDAGSSVASTATRLMLLEDAGDVAAADELLDELVAAVQSGARLPAGSAPAVGNAALRVARRRVRDAAILHLAAAFADPRHANVNQNLVDFVLDHRVESLYPTALETMERLAADPVMSLHRPVRRRILQNRLARVTGVGDAEPLDVLVWDVLEPSGEGEPIGGNELVDLFGMVRAERRFDLMPQVAGARMRAQRGDALRQAGTVRALGDGMTDGTGSEEEFGLEIYRFGLLSGLFRSDVGMSATALGRQAAEVLFNAALVFAARGDRDRAGYALYQALLANPDDEQTRLRMARWFNDADRRDEARALVEGRVDPDGLPVPVEPPFGPPVVQRSKAAAEWAAAYAEPRYGEPIIPELFDSPEGPDE